MGQPKPRKQLEKELNISPATFSRWVRNGKIKMVTPVTIPKYIVVDD